MRLSTNLKAGVSGVYAITSPSGKQYVGSSCDIRRRWYEHHWRMKNGRSSSPQLDRCYRKHGLLMKFEVIEICAPDVVRDREQYFLDALKPELNVSRDAYCAAKWIEASEGPRSAVSQGRQLAIQKRSQPIEDSLGDTYPSIAAAASAFGCSESVIRRRVRTHDPLDCGTRLRRVGDDWLPCRPPEGERRSQSAAKWMAERRASGGLKHNEEARRRKSERTRGVPWSAERRARFEAKSKGRTR